MNVSMLTNLDIGQDARERNVHSFRNVRQFQKLRPSAHKIDIKNFLTIFITQKTRFWTLFTFWAFFYSLVAKLFNSNKPTKLLDIWITSLVTLSDGF